MLGSNLILERPEQRLVELMRNGKIEWQQRACGRGSNVEQVAAGPGAVVEPLRGVEPAAQGSNRPRQSCCADREAYEVRLSACKEPGESRLRNSADVLDVEILQQGLVRLQQRLRFRDRQRVRPR